MKKILPSTTYCELSTKIDIEMGKRCGDGQKDSGLADRERTFSLWRAQ